MTTGSRIVYCARVSGSMLRTRVFTPRMAWASLDELGSSLSGAPMFKDR